MTFPGRDVPRSNSLRSNDRESDSIFTIRMIDKAPRSLKFSPSPPAVSLKILSRIRRVGYIPYG